MQARRAVPLLYEQERAPADAHQALHDLEVAVADAGAEAANAFVAVDQN